MNKRLLVLTGIVIAVLIVAGIMFATKGEEPTQERPAVSEAPSATEQRDAPEEKETKEMTEEEPKLPQPAPLPAKENSDEEVDSSVIKVSAEKLFSDFQENSVAARLKYDGEILEVTGEVAKIGSDALGDYVRLIGDKAMAGYGGLHFYGVNKEKEKVALLKRGQTVTIRGKLSLGIKIFSFIIPLRIDSIIE